MIIDSIIFLILTVVGYIFSFLPVVTIADIPYIGETVSTTLISFMGIWNAFIDTFPYAGIAWNVFLLAIIPFEILMIIAKFFFGQRAPGVHNVN